MVKISTIIPVYNAEKYLSVCLNSILNQTLKDIEIICIDDASTDNSLNILKSYQKKDKRIKIYTQEKGYAGKARNTGISLAKGKYINFVDADDIVYSNNVYKNLWKILKKNKCNILKGKGLAFKNSDNTILNDTMLNFENISNNLKNKNVDINTNIDNLVFLPDQPWTGIYDAKFLKTYNIKFSETVKLGEDVCFFMDCLYFAEKIYIYDDYMIFWRKKNETSLTNSMFENFEEYLNASKEIIDKYYKYPRSLKQIDIITKVLSNIFFFIFMYNYEINIEKNIRNNRLLQINSVFFEFLKTVDLSFFNFKLFDPNKNYFEYLKFQKNQIKIMEALK